MTALIDGTYAIDYDSVTNSGATYFGASFYGPNTGAMTWNFGATPFSYAVPSGCQAGLCQ
jgi:hypothetical protein